MAYTAKTAFQLRNEAGSLLQKDAAEHTLIAAEIGLAQRKFVTISSPTGTNEAVATTGIDLASGSDISVWGHFFPRPVTLVAMHDYLTEAYVKATTDAKIEVYNNASTPAKLFGRTLTATGEAAKAVHTTTPETGKAAVAAGTAITLKAVNTGSGTGTGHAIVVIEYLDAT